MTPTPPDRPAASPSNDPSDGFAPIHDERISAYLDGELRPAERSAFERELGRSPALQEALEEVASVRSSLRALPVVEPPEGLLSSPSVRAPARPRLRVSGAQVSPTRRWVLGGAGLAAAAAVLLVIGVFSGTGAGRIVPGLDGYLDQHASAAAGSSGPIEGFTMIGMDAAKASAPDMAPMQLAAAYGKDSIQHFVYDGGTMGMVSVFVQPGRCDFEKLPSEGEAMTMAGAVAWHAAAMHGQSVVVRDGQRDGRSVTYTVIGATSADGGVIDAASHL